jgi:hypothetical protein
MHTGLLWFDNDSKTTLSVKIQKALDYYSKKFGRVPEICLVNPSMLDKGQPQLILGKVAVRAYHPVMPNHFWIGVEDQK